MAISLEATQRELAFPGHCCLGAPLRALASPCSHVPARVQPEHPVGGPSATRAFVSGSGREQVLSGCPLLGWSELDAV